MGSEHERELVPLTEAAEVLGVSRVTMSRLVRQGVVTAYENPFDRRQKLLDLVEIRRLKANPEPIRRQEDGGIS